tara:strand:+ start:44905 stop:45960 length:1056 start_codon:yes stop_codon:yes gene_type:complete
MSFIVLEKSAKKRVEKAFTAYIKDSVQVEVALMYNRENLPDRYFSPVVTPVCEEGICYELVVDVYWDLLGNFLEYKESKEDPFTKFDHIRFTASDHQKMKDILADKTSLLANYEAKDLVDPRVEIKSDVIDGVTGATYKSLSGAVVKGAVYSSHTLWHIVNGIISAKIFEHTEKLLNDDLLVQMLQSSNYNQQFYALNKIDVEKKEFQPYLFDLLAKGESYVPFFAIEKLPESIWSSAEYQERSAELLPELEFKMQNEVLNKLMGKAVVREALRSLIKNSKGLRDNQIEKVFTILRENRKNLENKEMDKLADILYSENTTLSKNAYRILSEIKPQNKKVNQKVKSYERRIN